MPTKRTRYAREGIVIGYCESLTLLWGDSLLPGGSKLETLALPIRADWFVCEPIPHLLRRAWADNREWLLGEWNSRPPFEYAERPYGLPYPCGWLGVRAFCEIVLDGEPLPKPRKSWPRWAADAHALIALNVRFWTRMMDETKEAS
jgi:hypothetical protein